MPMVGIAMASVIRRASRSATLSITMAKAPASATAAASADPLGVALPRPCTR